MTKFTITQELSAEALRQAIEGVDEEELDIQLSE